MESPPSNITMVAVLSHDSQLLRMNYQLQLPATLVLLFVLKGQDGWNGWLRAWLQRQVSRSSSRNWRRLMLYTAQPTASKMRQLFSTEIFHRASDEARHGVEVP